MTDTLEIKQQVKEALFEFFKADNDYLRNVINEVVEDIAFGKAIEAGDVGDFVDEQQIIEVLIKDN